MPRVDEANRTGQRIHVSSHRTKPTVAWMDPDVRKGATTRILSCWFRNRARCCSGGGIIVGIFRHL